MSALLDMNIEKKYVVLFGSNSLKLSELFDINAEKKYVVLVGSNSQCVRITCYECWKKVCSIAW